MKHDSCFPGPCLPSCPCRATHVIYVMIHASYHKSSTSRFMLHLMLQILFRVVRPSSCHVSCPRHVFCFTIHVSFLVSCCFVSCFMSCFLFELMCLSCLIVDVKRVSASTSVDTIGMRSQIHEGRHGPRKHESCFMACFMLYVIYVTFHALGHALCLASCLASCFMACFMSTP